MTNITASNNEEAHEYVSGFIDEAYAKKKSDSPTTPGYRTHMTDVFCEAYFDQTGEYPASNVLSRLAWYITFDEMTDSNEHKMSHEETPFMSAHQTKLRFDRERSISDVYTGKDDETIGRSRGHDGISRRIYDYMTPERDSSLVPAEYMDLYDAIDNAGLTHRQREAISLVYFEGMTLEDAGKALGVSKQAVKQFVDAGNGNIKRYMSATT